MPKPTDESINNQFTVGKTEKMLAQYNDPTNFSNTDVGYRKINTFNTPTDPYNKDTNIEYPRMNPAYINGRQTIDVPPDKRENPIVLKPSDHELVGYRLKDSNTPIQTAKFFTKPKEHFTRDTTQNIIGEENTDITFINPNGGVIMPYELYDRKFTGATTQVNPYGDKEKAEIMENGGLSRYLEETTKAGGAYANPPTTPLHPFTRLNNINDQFLADKTIFNSYNRTKLPIADIEWRKGFRHIFITRPECYVMGGNGPTAQLCEQAMNDEDFQSAYTRMPHIVRLLAPWYVTGSYPKNTTNANWNFLLSNRVEGMQTAATTMTVNENISKSIEGFTVTPAMHVESRQGSTLSLTFKDTKNLEVFENARLWMLYMYKRKKGIFLPPFNGYQVKNGFIQGIGQTGKSMGTGAEFTRFHPYDRALEYCASLYDIITNESGTKILYWCKYYGIYPIEVSPALTNDANAPITEMTTTINFKYHYRLENSNRTLVEFNHDSGLTNDVGVVSSEKIEKSLPFLLRNEYDNPVMKKYIGAAGMFTGSPYIVMQKFQPDPLEGQTIITPNLRFMNITDLNLDGKANLGITNVEIDQDTKNLAAYQG